MLIAHAISKKISFIDYVLYGRLVRRKICFSILENSHSDSRGVFWTENESATYSSILRLTFIGNEYAKLFRVLFLLLLLFLFHLLLVATS